MRIEVQVFLLDSVKTHGGLRILHIVKQKIYYINIIQKKAGMATLLSDKVEFRAKKMTRD